MVQAQAAEAGQAGRAWASTASYTVETQKVQGSVVNLKRRDALSVHEAGLKSVSWQSKVPGKQGQHRSHRESFGTREERHIVCA